MGQQGTVDFEFRNEVLKWSGLAVISLNFRALENQMVTISGWKTSRAINFRGNTQQKNRLPGVQAKTTGPGKSGKNKTGIQPGVVAEWFKLSTMFKHS